MSDTTLIENFPAAALDEAKAALVAVNARLAKAAAKTGAAVPEEPTLKVVAERTMARCSRCRTIRSIEDVAKWSGNYAMCTLEFGESPVCFGTISKVDLVDVEVSIGRPALAGWEFLAVVEPLTAGNLVKRVPGSDTEFDLSFYRSCDALSCDHCNTIRNRLETFVVKADGTDPNIPAGTVKKVGRNCLENFLGGLSPAAILARLGFADVVRKIGFGDGEAGGGWGPRTEPTWTPLEILEWTAAVVRLDGWVPKSKASFEVRPTSEFVLYLLTPPWGAAGKSWFEARSTYRPTDGDKEKAAGALAWAAALAGRSDYEYSLSLLAKEARVKADKFGFLCSAVSGYERHLGKTVAAKKVNTTSAHVGNVGERIVVTVTVEKVIDFDTAYGTLHVNKMVDASGNVLVWKTTSVRYDVGKELTLKGTVKKHGEYHGVAETELSRCTEVPAGTAAPKPVKKSVDAETGEVEF